jgi:hypothetical protein
MYRMQIQKLWVNLKTIELCYYHVCIFVSINSSILQEEFFAYDIWDLTAGRFQLYLSLVFLPKWEA